jgi:hypothetical protein
MTDLAFDLRAKTDVFEKHFHSIDGIVVVVMRLVVNDCYDCFVDNKIVVPFL